LNTDSDEADVASLCVGKTLVLGTTSYRHIRATFVRRTRSGLRFTVDAYAKSENPIHSPERVLGQLSTRYWWPPRPPRDASHYLWSLTTSGSKHASGHSSLRISAPDAPPRRKLPPRTSAAAPGSVWVYGLGLVLSRLRLRFGLGLRLNLGLLTRVDDLPGRRTLRSTNANRLVVPPVKLSTVGSRAFAAPHIWNTLPTDVVAASSLSTFRRLLKRFLFKLSYPDIIY